MWQGKGHKRSIEVKSQFIVDDWVSPEFFGEQDSIIRSEHYTAPVRFRCR